MQAGAAITEWREASCDYFPLSPSIIYLLTLIPSAFILGMGFRFKPGRPLGEEGAVVVSFSEHGIGSKRNSLAAAAFLR